MDNSKPGLSPNLDVFLSAILEDYVPAAAATTFARELLGESDRTDAAAFARALCGESDPREAAAFAYELLRESDPARAAKILREYNFNPDELRDWRGQWTTGGSDSSPFKVCFAEGTPVLMADGAWKHIEEIQPGEIVLSVSEGNPEDKVDSKAVVQVYHNKPQPLVELYLDGGVIRTTANHPFHVRNRGWIPASQLQIANQFRGHDDQWVELRRKMISDAIKPVFNLQVADHHTYFVGAPNGRTSVLVHNDSPAGPKPNNSKPGWWDSFTDWLWTVMGYGAPAGSSEVAGALQVAGAALQADNIENYFRWRRDHEVEGTPEWKKWNQKWENCKKMRADAAKKQAK